MKRDLELIRSILMWAEQNCDGKRDITAPRLTITGYTVNEIEYQLRLLRDENFITYEGRKLKPVTRWVHFTRLTSQGNAFLQTLQDDSIWNKITKKLKDEALTTACETAISFAKNIILNG